MQRAQVELYKYLQVPWDTSQRRARRYNIRGHQEDRDSSGGSERPEASVEEQDNRKRMKKEIYNTFIMALILYNVAVWTSTASE